MRTDRLSYLYNMVSRTNSLAIYVIMATLLLQLANGELLLTSSTITDIVVESSTEPIVPKFTTKHLIVNDKINSESSAGVDVVTNTTKMHATIVKKISTNNELWDALINECLRKPTMSCLQKNVHSYLDGTLALQDVNVTGNFKFLQNKVDPYKYTKEAYDQDEIENDIPDEDEARSGTFTTSALCECCVRVVCLFDSYSIFLDVLIQYDITSHVLYV